MVQNPCRLDLICVKITTGRLAVGRKRNRDCGRYIYMENCGELSALTKTAAVLKCIGPRLQNATNYRQSSKSKVPNGWLIPWDKPVFHTKRVGHKSIPVERKRALEQTFASKQQCFNCLMPLVFLRGIL